MLETLSSADFATLPDGRISVLFGDTERLLEIIEITELPQTKLRDARPFSMLLRDNGARSSMPQDTYLYRHPVHGSLALFTVPMGPDAHGFRYEIILN